MPFHPLFRSSGLLPCVLAHGERAEAPRRLSRPVWQMGDLSREPGTGLPWWIHGTLLKGPMDPARIPPTLTRIDGAPQERNPALVPIGETVGIKVLKTFIRADARGLPTGAGSAREHFADFYRPLTPPPQR